ncbi:MAG: YlmC/YmxH family sporulation protein [Clostridia bacterium]|nr:MAG: YlmC/YmxH family sporulation protein [Clostridia bacterium]
MRFSELIGKEIINIYDGTRMGHMMASDLIIDPQTGMIVALVVPARGWSVLGGRQNLTIPWEAVKKVGLEVLVVDLDQNQVMAYRQSY